MHWYHVHQALRAARLSGFERDAFRAGAVLLITAVLVAVAGWDAGGLARVFGLAGLVAVVACPVSRAARLYLAEAKAALPTSVARVPVQTRPARGFSAITAVLALGLPLAAGVALVGVLVWGWLLVALVLLFGGLAMFITWVGRTRRGEEPYAGTSTTASELLQRLCMRAGMRAPGLVVTPGPSAIAWTAGGRIHLTRPLLDLLDDAELEAVLAHELAHIAHRDAVVVEICSAPSRVLLACARTLSRWLAFLVKHKAMFVPGGGWVMGGLAALVALCVPPAFVVGWTSRLSVLGISRAREFSADAAAATLTGRPSALASALMKLERQREWTPRDDLRQVEAYAVLCIVGAGDSRLGRFFWTHPPVAARVRRLEALEVRIQGRAHRVQL